MLADHIKPSKIVQGLQDSYTPHDASEGIHTPNDASEGIHTPNDSSEVISTHNDSSKGKVK